MRIQRLVQEGQAPGLSLAIGRNGSLESYHGFGYRDVAAGLPVTLETVFGVASVTKSFTCLAVMQLADRGRLSVEDPVVKWLPEFRVPHPEWNRAITIHHLMTHSSGLPGLSCLFGARAASIQRDPNRERLGLAHDPFRVPPVETYEDLMRVMAETDYALLGAPGTRFNYSNEGYALLQGIIERASGQDFLSYMQANVLDPVGMAHSCFRTEELARFPEVTELYAAEIKDGRREVFHAPVWWDVASIYTNGSLKASAGDLLRYLEVYRTGGLAGGVRILSEAAVRQMITPHIPYPTGQRAYGYGLMVETTPQGWRLIHHGGSIKGVASHVAVVPERGLSVVTLCNLSGFDSEAVSLAAIEEAEGLPPDALAREFPPYEAGALDEYIGEYRSQEGDRAVVEWVDGALRIDSAGQQMVVEPFGPDAFVWRRERKPFRFLRDGEGRVESLFMGGRVLPRA